MIVGAEQRDRGRCAKQQRRLIDGRAELGCQEGSLLLWVLLLSLWSSLILFITRRRVITSASSR